MAFGGDATGPSAAIPTAMAFGASAIAALGFGAGYGSRIYNTSTAFKELLEKFPEPPTPQAEALARAGAGRAFVYGTGVAGLMGIGALAVARSYGITSAADFGEEAKKWLPSAAGLESRVEPMIAPLQRTITENLQSVRDRAGGQYAGSKLGRSISRRAQGSESAAAAPLEQWEKELVRSLSKSAGIAVEEEEAKKGAQSGWLSKVGKK